MSQMPTVDFTAPIEANETGRSKAHRSGELKRDCLSYIEVLAQSVSVIAPSTVPAAILGLIFASAGNGTWLSFLFGMVGMILVSLNINEFARRSASPASLYSYIVKGLGSTPGVLGGWALLFGYATTGMSTLCGFALFVNVVGAPLRIHVPPLLSFAMGAAGAWYVAYRDIQLSAKMMLATEGLVLFAILVLGLVIWSDKGFAVDAAQLRLEGVTPNGVLSGVLLVVFAFSGFESSTSLGHEAKDPLRTIPRSVIQSVVISGLIFVFMSYVVVLGYRGTAMSLATAEAPLDVLANSNGWKPLSMAINIGILLSFFSCTLACVNSTARIVFSMARHGLVAEVFGAAHQTNKTPYTAVGATALVTFLMPTALYLAGASVFDAQGWFGTLCSYGFLLTYVLISFATPIYLKRVGQLTRRALLVSSFSIAFMALPALGTVGVPGSMLFPPPAFPQNVLFLAFGLYMLMGVGWVLARRARQPRLLTNLRSTIDDLELRFAAQAVRKEKSHSTL